ncbi:MAG: tetratricopeptide repeat protein [Candidatus Melainabacteria bacterium]|nr:tetratricopeptide repeat protein [Candidatus Melainabacteria bacterium]
MKTISILIGLTVAIGALSACKPEAKTTTTESTTETSTTTTTTTTATDTATSASKEPGVDYMTRDVDTNIKEGNQALQDKQFDKAERIFLAALAQCDLYPKQEARQGAILNNLAAIYEEKEMYAQAVPLLNKAQKLFIRAFGRKNKTVYITLGNLGRVLSKQHRWEEAANVYQTAVSLMSEDSAAMKSAEYKDMVTKCQEAWSKGGNAFKSNKMAERLKTIK